MVMLLVKFGSNYDPVPRVDVCSEVQRLQWDVKEESRKQDVCFSVGLYDDITLFAQRSSYL